MDNTNTGTLIGILQSAREIGNTTIAKEAVIGLAKEYGVAVTSSRYKSIADISLYTPLTSNNRITAIKELRERAMENGLPYGLAETKAEVDNRIAEEIRANRYESDDLPW